ncbi:hypothetical protein CPC08DRAFT_702646 [Agrocybe pediades]|nr:hypothetical protein CPC08DRAFT_702646 [Agrocybe pediades]
MHGHVKLSYWRSCVVPGVVKSGGGRGICALDYFSAPFFTRSNARPFSVLYQKHGGTVSPGYSGVPYILVDPHKPSGQNLWRQYAGKKSKIVLSVNWVHECIKANQLQTFHSNWAGCKVTGNETIYQPPAPQPQPPPVAAPAPQPPQPPQAPQARRPDEPPSAPQAIHPHALQAAMPPVDALHSYPFQVYTPAMHPNAPRGMVPPPQPWQVPMGPPQPHLHPPPAPVNPHPHLVHRPPPIQASPQQQYRDDAWDRYNTPDDLNNQPTAYDYPRYRDEPGTWVPGGPGPYYEAAYDQNYAHAYMESAAAGPSSGPNGIAGQPSHLTGSVTPNPEVADKPRGRKRTRTQPTPAAPASSLVVNRNPPARSPTPPTRVIKSTYGGNLFTAEDVEYLKKYIDYCQDQCLVLSLREICERIAVKAPHHTFYSWRRYCNKHQIRLGGYTMNNDRSESPGMGEDIPIEVEGEMGVRPTRLDMTAATAAAASAATRNRSPTPPRALYRSTTGKGVAFTQEDVTFLVRFMEYRKSQGALDMVAFWKDVAAKAPHHSRASWMKFWRRHKHELARSEGDEPLPAPPDKKMRYSKEDDILLAKFFVNKPDGTSDKIFQAFGRQHPHHPWKGWQEHHRIHKTKIEHLMQLLANGEDIDNHDMDES